MIQRISVNMMKTGVFIVRTAVILGKTWGKSMSIVNVCRKYPGDCTVTEAFCARRHKLAISYKPSSFNVLSDQALDCSLCATCEVGIYAYSKLSNTINVKQKESKSRLGGLSAKKTKRLRKYESPYSNHYTGGNNVMSL